MAGPVARRMGVGERDIVGAGQSAHERDHLGRAEEFGESGQQRGRPVRIFLGQPDRLVAELETVTAAKRHRPLDRRLPVRRPSRDVRLPEIQDLIALVDREAPPAAFAKLLEQRRRAILAQEIDHLQPARRSEYPGEGDRVEARLESEARHAAGA